MSDWQTVAGTSDADDIWAFSNADDELTLAVIGDYGTGNVPELNVASLVYDWKPNAIVTVGDNGQATSDYDLVVGNYYGEYVTRGAFFPVPGNVDWDYSDLVTYLDYFDSIIDDQYYYHKSLGPVDLFLLDSDSRTPDGNTSSGYQAQWLEARMAQSTADWKIVICHHAPYSNDDVYGDTTAMQWDFDDFGANLVLAGHTHTYERLSVGGVPYINCGMGGAPLRNFRTTSSTAPLKQYNSLNGALKLIASPTRLIARFYSYDGAKIDELDQEK